MIAVFIHRGGLSLYSITNKCPTHLLTKIFPGVPSETHLLSYWPGGLSSLLEAGASLQVVAAASMHLRKSRHSLSYENQVEMLPRIQVMGLKKIWLKYFLSINFIHWPTWENKTYKILYLISQNFRESSWKNKSECQWKHSNLPLSRIGNWILEKPSHFPRVTQQVTDRASTKAQICWLPG